MYGVAPIGSLPFGTMPPFVPPAPVGASRPVYGMYGVSPIGAGAYGTAALYVAPAPVPA